MPRHRTDPETLKANVRRLAERGASEDDIHAYIQGEGYSQTAEPSFKDDARDALATAYQGLTFGLGDKLTAATRAVLPEKLGGTKGFDYSGALKEERERLTRFRQAHPYVAATAETVGGVVPALATAGTSQAPTLLNSMKMGAGYGAMYGAGEQDSPDLAQLLKGTAVGAATGAAAAGVVHGATAVPGRVLDFAGVRPEPASTNRMGRLAARAGVGTTEDRALETVLARMGRGGVTPADATIAAREASDMGKPASLLEVGGKQVTRLGRGVQGIPSKGADVMQTALETRRRGAASRVAGDVESGLGQPRADMFEATQELAKQQRAKASPFYERAMQSEPLSLEAKSPKSGVSLAEILRRPSAQKAIGYESQLANEEGRAAFPDMQLLEALGPNVKAVSMEQLHNIKLRMDEMLGYAKAKGTLPDGTPATSKMLRAIQDSKKSLLDIMDAHSSDYAAGRKSWAGDAELQDGLELGRDFLNSKRPLGELKHDLQELSEAGQEQARRGVVSAVREKIDAAQDGADVARRIFGNEAQRQRLRAAFPDERSFARFRRQMEWEAQMAKNENTILGNSQTAEKLGDVQDLLETRLPQGGNLLTLRGAANAALRRADMLRGGVASRAQADALAPILTAGADRTQPRSLEEVLGLIAAHQGRVAPRRQAASVSRTLVGGMTGQEVVRPR